MSLKEQLEEKAGLNPPQQKRSGCGGCLLVFVSVFVIIALVAIPVMYTMNKDKRSAAIACVGMTGYKGAWDMDDVSMWPLTNPVTGDIVKDHGQTVWEIKIQVERGKLTCHLWKDPATNRWMEW